MSAVCVVLKNSVFAPELDVAEVVMTVDCKLVSVIAVDVVSCVVLEM
jgi:hypothetical protein